MTILIEYGNLSQIKYSTHYHQIPQILIYHWMTWILILISTMMLPIILCLCVSTTLRTVLRKKMFNVIDSKSLSVWHVNIRSLQCKFYGLKNYFSGLEIEFTLLGVTETWINDMNCDYFSMSAYHFIKNHRSDRSGGGVGIFLRRNCDFCIRDHLVVFNNLFESVFIEIQNKMFNTGKNIIVGVIYRPPGTDMDMFDNELSDRLDSIKSENKLCYLLGDYNINILNYESHEPTAYFVNSMYSFGFVPLINRPARITQLSSTIIDNIFTNNHNALIKFLSGNPGHRLIWSFSSINQDITAIEQDVFIVKHSFTAKNKHAFQEDLKIVDWQSIYSINDTQAAFSQFYQKLLNLYDKNFPKRKIKLRYNHRKPWLSEGLRYSIKQKIDYFTRASNVKQHIMKSCTPDTGISWNTSYRRQKKIIMPAY